MTALKFCRGPDIDDRTLLHGFLRSKIGEVDPFFFLDEQSGGLCLGRGDPAENLIEPDAIKLPDGKVCIPRLLEHQQDRIVLGKVGAGSRREKRRTQWRMNRSRNMRGVEDLPIISRIQNLNTVALGSTGKLARMEMRRLRYTSGNGDTIAVDALHGRKVKRRIRLAGEDVLDECDVIAEGQFERAIEPALVAEGGGRHSSERLAARAARTMGRKQLQVIVESCQAISQGLLELLRRRFHCPFLGDRGFEKVRPADVADENEIACEQCHRLICPVSQVGDQIA